ncbi:hypothetical protein D3C85_1923450 [compost metagenome]
MLGFGIAGARQRRNFLVGQRVILVVVGGCAFSEAGVGTGLQAERHTDRDDDAS